ncbi:MAG: GNAT family N-acetyltransferase [Pseudomonadota bacterium]
MMRPAGAEAAAELAQLHARAFDTAWSAADIAKLLENPTAYAVIASENEPQGFILAWSAAGDAEILTLAVIPEARRKGVGLGLVNAACAAALVRGAAAMSLDVAADNAPARALYAKLGFEEAGLRPRYYRRPQGDADALILRRALPRPVV